MATAAKTIREVKAMLTEIRLIVMIALWVTAIFGGIMRKRGHKQLADILIAIFDIGVVIVIFSVFWGD
jgi:hypothetical protein